MMMRRRWPYLSDHSLETTQLQLCHRGSDAAPACRFSGDQNIAFHAFLPLRAAPLSPASLLFPATIQIN